MKKLIVLCGPPGSGKTTVASKYELEGYVRISQDVMGADYLQNFDEAVLTGADIIVDRMDFSKSQRQLFTERAKSFGYNTTIIVLHEPYDVCLDRCLKRKNHETIKNEKSAKAALKTFFTKYERVQDNEADEVKRVWPVGNKPMAICSDLDGTLCNLDNRLHFAQGEGKKDWKSFFEELVNDTPNKWCSEILKTMSQDYRIIYCSGRPSNYRDETYDWLHEYGLDEFPHEYSDGEWTSDFCELFMRHEGDHRADTVAKEILLDFEILTRFEVLFVIDDRPSVCRMWRSRGLTVLQCQDREF